MLRPIVNALRVYDAKIIDCHGLNSEIFFPAQFPGEVINYWLQHSLIFFIVPPYLIYIWGMLTAGYEGEGMPL